jgi:hypothetical protein
MKRPSRLMAITDPVRAAGEMATSISLLTVLPLLPKGDGHPVFVLPGFMAGDRSTWVLRRTLSAQGYEVYPWSLGRNLGPTPEVVEGIPARLREIFDRHGEPVSIVGQSLGGIYARVQAARHPEIVRQVVTLGTPVKIGTRAVTNAQPLYQWLDRRHAPATPQLDDGVPLEVPVTAIHTVTDGIVSWEACIVQPAPNAENIRIVGSHLGMGVNPAVVYIVAERLAQPAGTWAPFEVPQGTGALIAVSDSPRQLNGKQPFA